jgi:hypothetical protein
MTTTLGWLAIWFVGLVGLPLIATWIFEAENEERVLVAFFWTLAVATLSSR